MEKLTSSELLPLLGKNFRDTLIVDDVFGPHFIIKYSDGGFGVMKTRKDLNGKLKWRVLGYPASFMGALDMIAKQLQHEEGKVYESIQSYIETWKEISNKVLTAYKDWDVKQI